MCMGLGNSTFPAIGCLKTCAPKWAMLRPSQHILLAFTTGQDHGRSYRWGNPFRNGHMVLSHERLQTPHSVWHRLPVIWLLSHGALRCQEQDTIVWQLAILKVLTPCDAMGSLDTWRNCRIRYVTCWCCVRVQDPCRCVIESIPTEIRIKPASPGIGSAMPAWAWACPGQRSQFHACPCPPGPVLPRVAKSHVGLLGRTTVSAWAHMSQVCMAGHGPLDTRHTTR